MFISIFRALKVWKNSSWIRSLFAKNWTSSTSSHQCCDIFDGKQQMLPSLIELINSFVNFSLINYYNTRMDVLPKFYDLLHALNAFLILHHHHKKWIVIFCRIFSNSQCCSMSKTIRITNYKTFKSIFRIKWRFISGLIGRGVSVISLGGLSSC